MKLPLWLWGSHSRRACPLPVTSDKHIRPQPSPQLGTKLYNLGSAHQKPPAQSVNWKEVKCQSRHTRDTDAFEPLQWFKLQHLKSRAKQVSGIHWSICKARLTVSPMTLCLLSFFLLLLFFFFFVAQHVGEGSNRGWDGWMASLTQRTWVWANPRGQRRIRRPGVLQFMGLQRVRCDLASE